MAEPARPERDLTVAATDAPIATTPVAEVERAVSAGGNAALHSLARAPYGPIDPPTRRGGRPTTARGVIELQRSAGNAATTRMLHRKATAPPAMLMPTETEPAKMIAEGWQIAKRFGWEGVELVAAVGNWIHMAAKRDPQVHAWPVTHRWLGKGVYMFHRDELVQKAADGRDARLRLTEEAARETLEVSRKHGRVALPDWTDVSYVEMHNINAALPGPWLLIVGDPAEMTDTLGPDEKGPGELHGIPPLDSKIQGTVKQPVGATGAYQMNLDWTGAGIDLGTQAISSLQKVKYDWEVRQITASDEELAEVIRKAVTSRADPTAAVNPWDTFRHDTRRRTEELNAAPKHYEQDLLQALKEGRAGGVISNALNLQLVGVQTIATLGGVLLDGWLTLTNDGQGASIAWKQEGRYLLKCTARLDPDTPRVRSSRFREDSVAAIVVDVRTAKSLSEEPFTTEDEEARKLDEQTRVFSEDDTGELSEFALVAAKQQQEQWVKTRGGVVDALSLAIGKLDEAIIKRQRDDPMGQTYARLEREHPGALRDPVVVDLEDKRDDVKKRKALVERRRGWMREKDPDRPIYRLRAYYVSSVTGTSYPLLLEVAEPAVLVAGKWWATDLQDATSSSSEMQRGVYARSPADAVWKAIDALAGTLPPGVLTAKLPDAIPGEERARTFETRLKDEKATKERLTELATILAIVGLIATGAGAAAIGLAAGIAGAAASAISLVEKWRNGTLASNPLETVMDVVNVCAGFLAGVESGAVRLIIPKGSKVFYLVPRAEQFASTATRAVIAPAAFAMGDIQVLNDMIEAGDQERSGQITAVEASRRRTQAVVNGVVLTHMGLLADVIKGGGHAEGPVGEKPAKPAGDEPAGGTRGASYELDNTYKAKKTITDDKSGATRTIEFERGGLTTVNDDFTLKLSSAGAKGADAALKLIGGKLPEGATLAPVSGKKFTEAAKDTNVVPARMTVPDPRPGAKGAIAVDVRVKFVDAADLPASGHVGPGGEDLGGPVRLRPSHTAADGWKVEVFVDSRMRAADLDHAIGHELAEMTEIVRGHPAGASDDVVRAEMGAGVFTEGYSEPAVGARPTAHDRAAAWELRSMIDELPNLRKGKPETLARRLETIKRLMKSMGLESFENWQAKLDALREAGFDDTTNQALVSADRSTVAREYKLRVAQQISDRLKLKLGNPHTVFDAKLVEHTFFAKYEGGTVSGGHRTAALQELATHHPDLAVREVATQTAGGTTVRKFELYLRRDASKPKSQSVFLQGDPFIAAEWKPIIDPVTKGTAIKTTADSYEFIVREGDSAWASWKATNGLPAPSPTGTVVRKFTQSGPSGVVMEGFFDVDPATSTVQFQTLYPVL